MGAVPSPVPRNSSSFVSTAENTSTLPGLPVTVSLADLGLHDGAQVRDLWTHRELGEFTGEFVPVIPFHGAGLYRLSPNKTKD